MASIACVRAPTGSPPKRRSPAAWPSARARSADGGSGGISRSGLDDRRLRFGAVARFPEEPAQPVVQAPESGQVRTTCSDVVELRGHDGRLTELDGPRIPSGQDGALRCPPDEGGVVERRVRVGAVVPQRQRLFVLAPGLDERVDTLRGLAGPDQGRDRAGRVACLHPVVGELAGRDRHAADLAAALQLGPECRVQPLTLAVEQLGRGGLGQQGVTEGVATEPTVDVSGVLEDAVRERGAEGIGDGGLRHPQDDGEHLVIDPPAGDGRRPQQAPGGIGLIGKARHEHIVQAWWQPTIGGGAGRGKLLDEEWVATGPLGDRSAVRRRSSDAQPTEESGDVGRVQWSELQSLDPSVALQLGDESRARVRRLEIVRADRHQQQHSCLPEVARKEANEGSRPIVRPLQILDDHHDRRLAGAALDHVQDRLEQAALSRAIVLGRLGRGGGHPTADLREQALDLGAGRSEQCRDTARIDRADQLAQALDERRIGHGPAAGRQARTGEDGHAASARALRDYRDESALPDAGLAADDDRPAGRRSSGDPVERSIEPGDLRCSPDDPAPFDPLCQRPPILPTGVAGTSWSDHLGHEIGADFGAQAGEHRSSRPVGPSDRSGDLLAPIPHRRHEEHVALDRRELR